jgi:acetoin:2,6-dichlorophenolindophenol oxidoreductase subunit beta
MSTNTYRKALEVAMNKAMDENENTLIIGQGVADFKGLFGTTSGLAIKYPNRVIETPLAEDSIAGICIGASLNGMYPINTHIRADFGLLVFNQLINLAAKYKYMFGGLFEVPMMMRMIIGRSWGQGAQHSQSLQSLMAHIPGLVVVMPASPQSILESYDFAVNHHRGPVVMLEHRLMYEIEFENRKTNLSNPLMGSILEREGKDVTIVATSVMVLEAKRTADYLASNGISVEIIDLHSISHPDKKMITESVKKTGKLLVVDTSWTQFGVAAEINRIINESDPSILKSPSISLGMAQAPCPTAKALEDIYYPDVHDIVVEVLKLAGNPDKLQTTIPQKQSMTDFYKHFKGPF